MSKKPALGKGLSALLESAETDITSNKNSNEAKGLLGTITNLPLDTIEINPFQPRTEFDEEALNELADSIKQIGIIQPVTVRKLGYDKFQLISGERRFRASKIAGLTEIPAYIRIANDQSMLEMALVENIQRENLDAIEVAISYNRLIDECSLTQAELSDRVGKKRSTVTNYLRLLKLPIEIQSGIRKKKISMGHARALVNIEDEDIQARLYNEIIDKGLSVRQIEQLAKTASSSPKAKKEIESFSPMNFSNEQESFKLDLSEKLDTSVSLKKDNKGKGKIVIPFKSEKDLDRIINLLNK